MSRRSEEAACEYAGLQNPPTDDSGVLTATDYYTFLDGYEQAEKETLERAIEWWRPRLCGFLKEGLTEGVLGEFRKAMEE